MENETIYRGRCFRSEIDARWAVFFDVLSIECHYEPQKFAGSKGVPAFFLPSMGFEDHKTLIPAGVFMDVAIAEPQTRQRQDALRVRRETGREVVLFWGSDFRTGLKYSQQTHDWHSVAFTQCPFCGRVDVSAHQCDDYENRDDPRVDAEINRRFKMNWNDGTALFSMFDHCCIEECEFAEHYNILSHFNQDYLTPARSPMLDLAIQAAMEVGFTSGAKADDLVRVAREKARSLASVRAFCFPEQKTAIADNAVEWAKADPEFMYYDEPWYVKHKKNRDNGISPCDCYSCVWDALRSIGTADK